MAFIHRREEGTLPGRTRALAGHHAGRLRRPVRALKALTTAAAAAWMLCAGTASAAEILERQLNQARVDGGGKFVLSVYANSTDAWLHLQPNGAGSEQLFDARTGTPLSQAPAGFATARRLGFVDTAQLQRDGDAGRRVEYLKLLGCGRQHRWCTVVDDGQLLVLASYSAAEQTLAWELVDARALLRLGMQVFAGQAVAPALTATERALLDHAAQYTGYGTALMEATESIDSIERLDALRGAVRQLDLCQWRAFTCSDRPETAIDLRQAQERQFIQVYAAAFAQRLLSRQDAQAKQQLVQFLLKVTAPPFPAGGSAAHAVEAFQRFSPSERTLIVRALKDYSGPQQETIHCTALWTESAPCRASAPAVQPSSSAGRGTGTAATAAATEPKASNAAAARPAPVFKTPAPVAPWTSLPEEWNAIRKYPQRVQLLNIAEVQGILTRDNSAIGGMVFTARALGKASEGRYEISARIADGSPVPVQFGTYRVKLELSLQYVREDVCAASRVRCLLTPASNDRVAKTEERDIALKLEPSRHWQDSNSVSFGSLLPLTADGGSLYRSELREVRLVVKDAHWVRL